MTKDVTLICKSCGAVEWQFLFSANDLRFGLPGEFKIFQCKSCDLACIQPQPPQDELRLHYPDNYYTHLLPKKNVKEKLESILLNILFVIFEGTHASKKKNVLFRELARAASRSSQLMHKVEVNAFDYLTINGGELLEIGFGNGAFLDFASKNGYSTYGVDPDPINCRNTEGRQHKIICGELTDAKYQDNKFDFIRMRHVLEHVTDPANELREILRVQKPGGYLFLEVPNFGGLYARIFKDLWAQLEAPRHLFHFNPENLRGILKQSGYEIIRTTFETQPWHLLGSMKYAMNGMGKSTDSVGTSLDDIRLDGRVSSSLHTLSRWLVSHGYGDNIILLAKKPSQ